ncbi:MAG: DUF1573 domain-containing protein [Bacteroidia bacterium]|nr:DUF1573 domain-containing protein [Bacteroidia bacterium]
MNKIIIVLNIVIGLSSCSKKQPFVFIKDKVVYMDTIQADSTKKLQICIYNTGQSTLIIEGIKTSCECTVINTINNTTVAINDSLLVPIEIKGYKNDIGKQKEVVCTIRTNAPSIFDSMNIYYWTK